MASLTSRKRSRIWDRFGRNDPGKNDPISDPRYVSKKAIAFVRYAPRQGDGCVYILLILIGFIECALGLLAMGWFAIVFSWTIAFSGTIAFWRSFIGVMAKGTSLTRNPDPGVSDQGCLLSSVLKTLRHASSTTSRPGK